jgi:hypothetical protein
MDVLGRAVFLPSQSCGRATAERYDGSSREELAWQGRLSRPVVAGSALVTMASLIEQQHT